MIAGLLGLLLPTAIVYWALAPRRAAPGAATARLLSLALSMGLAVGLTSCLWFVSLAWLNWSGPTYLAAETLLLSLAALVWRRRVEPRALPPAPVVAPMRPSARSPMPWAVPALAALTVGWIVSFAATTHAHPHGTWDAVSIWNLHARFLSAAGDRWLDFFRHGDACAHHADYPLLIPGAIARLVRTTGASHPAAAALIAWWFSAATVLLCGAAVGCVRGRNQALLAAVALLGTSYFVKQSSSQYADVPLGWYILAALAAFVLDDASDRRSPGWLALAGIASGLAAWTKNEGLLFAGVIAALFAITSLRRIGARATLRRSLPLAAGLALVLLVIGYFKVSFAPVNDLVAGQQLQTTVSRLLDPIRYWQITVGLVGGLIRMTKVLCFLLPIYFVLMGRTARTCGRDGVRFALAAQLLVLLGYIGVYLTSPNTLDWHLETSARRLLLHLWPGSLAIFFLMVAAPEERGA